jgi:hypothetical protein
MFIKANDPNKIEIKSGSLALVSITPRKYLPGVVPFGVFLVFLVKKTSLLKMLKTCAGLVKSVYRGGIGIKY